MGHEVDVYTTNGSSDGRELPRSCTVQGLRVRRFGALVSLGQFGKVWPGFLPSLVSGRYDVIHSHVYRHPHTDMANVASKISGSTSVLTSHSPFHPAEVRGAPARVLVPLYDTLIARVSLRSFDRIISLTRAEAETLSTLSGGGRRISVVPHGVEDAHFARVDSGRFLSAYSLSGGEFVLYLGRIDPTKGLHLLVEAFSGVAQAFPNVALVLAGPCQGARGAAYAAELRRQASRLGVERRVVFTSHLSEEDKLAAYESCSVFVLPSLYEPFGIALLEAAAHGKPLIASRTDGPASIISEGETGFLFPPGDAKELARLLGVLLSDQGLRRALGEKARKFASSRRWDRVAEETLEAYRGGERLDAGTEPLLLQAAPALAPSRRQGQGK